MVPESVCCLFLTRACFSIRHIAYKTGRRAKLKRLTSDDREKALIPRTLPDGFDITEDIYSLYGSWHQSSNNALTHAGIYSNPIQKGNSFTPLISVITRKPCDEDYTTSPLSASSACDGYFPSPTSALATGSEHETPPITIGDDSSSRFALFCNPQASALRYMSPSTRTSNFSHFSSQSYCHHVPDLFQPITTNPRTVSLESSYEQNLSYNQTISGYGTPDATSPVVDMPYRSTHSFDTIPPQPCLIGNLSPTRKYESSSLPNIGHVAYDIIPAHNQFRKSEPSRPSSLWLQTAPTNLRPDCI